MVRGRGLEGLYLYNGWLKSVMTALTASFNLLSRTRPAAFRLPDAKSDESSGSQVFVGFRLAGNLAKHHVVTAQTGKNQGGTPLGPGRGWVNAASATHNAAAWERKRRNQNWPRW